VSRENWCESPDPRLSIYLKVIDCFAFCMKKRVEASTPRTWAQFWRVFAEEQNIQRMDVMQLVPHPYSFSERNGDWSPLSARAARMEARAKRKREQGYLD